MQNQMTNHTGNTNLAHHNGGSNVLGEILTAAAIYLIPHLPCFISRILNYPSEMMANGYCLDVVVGQTKVHFGPDHKNEKEVPANEQ